jgi:hypothetical protein
VLLLLLLLVMVMVAVVAMSVLMGPLRILLLLMASKSPMLVVRVGAVRIEASHAAAAQEAARAGQAAATQTGAAAQTVEAAVAVAVTGAVQHRPICRTLAQELLRDWLLQGLLLVYQRRKTRQLLHFQTGCHHLLQIL